MNTLNELLVHPIFQRLGWTLVHSIWQGAAVAFVVAIALVMLGRRSSQSRYVVACAALLLMLAAPIVTFFVLPGPILRPDVVAPTDQPIMRAAAVMVTPIHVAPVIQNQPPLTLAQKLQQLLPACAAFWIIGIAVISIRHVGGWMRVQQLRNGATRLTGEPWDALMSRVCECLHVKRAVAIAESALVQVPSVIGYLKPIILLPACVMAGLSPQQLEGLIAHELAHVRRHDYLVNLLQIVIETLLFYHPAAWWLSKRIRQERENCCDDLAATVCGNRVAYVQALAAMEELRMVPGELVLAARGGSLLPRVRRLLGVQTPRQRNWSLTAAIVVVIVALVPLIVAQHKAKAEEAEAATKPSTTTASNIRPADLIASTNEYSIGSGDLVSVSTIGLKSDGQETVKNMRVNQEGSISLPLVGSIKAAGSTAADLEKAIAKAYEGQKLPQKPKVTVSVLEARSRTFIISEAVHDPGQYAILQNDFRLLDALVLAKGLTGSPETISVIRDDPSVAGGKRIIEVPTKQLMAGDPKVNIVIHGGDMIVAPQPIVRDANPAPTQPIADNSRSSTTTRSAAVRPEDLVAEKTEYRIEPSDLVQVSIMELTGAGVETVKQERVSDKGEIPLPYLGRVKAAGMTESELEKSIAKAYADKSIIHNPQVAVSIVEARGRTFSILGNVARAGEYALSPSETRLLDALVTAGGLTDSPQTATIIRKSSDKDADPRYIQVPLKELTSGDLKYNVVIHPKDMVIVGTSGNVPANDVGNAPSKLPDVPKAPPLIDVQTKALLDKELPEANFDAVALGDVIDFLRDVTNANIFVNWKSLESVGIDKNAPVTLRVRNVSFGKVLDMVLQSAGGSNVKLGYTVDQSVITISAAAEAEAGGAATSDFTKALNAALRDRLVHAQLDLEDLKSQGVNDNNPNVVRLTKLIESLSRDLQLPTSAPVPAPEEPFDPTKHYTPEGMRNLTIEQRMALRRYSEQHPATQPLYRAVRIVVGPEKMTLEGKETTWDKAKEELAKLPNRGDLVLEVAVASDQMTLKQHQEAVGRGMQLASQLSFKYVSDVGVHPLGSKAGDDAKASTQPSGKSADEQQRAGEYYVMGAVKREGVYSKTARNITLKQALIAAEVEDKAKFVRLIRSEAGQPETARDFTIEDLMNAKVEDPLLHFNDQVIASETKPPAAHDAGAAVQVPDKMPLGEYYVGGHIKRPGVYSTTGRHISIRQALIASGGTDDDGKYANVFRRNAEGKTENVLSVEIGDVFTPGSQHNVYLEPDDTLMVTEKSGAEEATTKP